MSRTVEIECPCGNVCGRYHPAVTMGDPLSCYESYAEGPGEDFSDSDGNWYCSQVCLDTHNQQVKENNDG